MIRSYADMTRRGLAGCIRCLNGMAGPFRISYLNSDASGAQGLSDDSKEKIVPDDDGPK